MHTRYRTYLGKKHTLVDRRWFWASADRELVGLNGLRKGEFRARRSFWRAIRKGMDASEALRECIGLTDGPIPELHTEEQFAEIWTDGLVREVADRWKQSKLTQSCAAEPVRTAVSKLEEAGPDFADTLITIARNPYAKDSDRRAAARDGLAALGVKLVQPTVSEVSPIRLTGHETPEQLEALLLQVAQLEPDPNRARLLSETIRQILKAKKPDVWGDRLEVKATGSVGLGPILIAMDRRRAEALADDDRGRVIETTAEPVPIPEAKRR